MRNRFAQVSLMIAALWLAMPLSVSAAEDARPASKRELRSAMSKAEKRFFDLYNQVNEDGRHKMSCESTEMTGSRLSKGRACKTQGQSSVSEAAAREYLNDRSLSDSMGESAATGIGGGPIPQNAAPAASPAARGAAAVGDAASKMSREKAAFEAHLQALLDKHPELQQRLDEYVLARTRYEAAGS